MDPFAMKDLQKRRLFFQNGTNVYKRWTLRWSVSHKTLYNTSTPTCVTKDVQIIVCGKRQLLKTKVPWDCIINNN